MPVLDIYDDPQGKTLARLLNGRDLPEKVASSRLLDARELDVLPDRLFALVAEDNGSKLRKYAMCDEAHMTTSILYFLGRGEALPPGVRSKVAGNLVNACAWYDMDPPEALVKIAIGLGGVVGIAGAAMDAKDLGDKTRNRANANRQAFDDFRRAQASGAKVASGREIELSMDQEKAVVEDRGQSRVMEAASQISQRDATQAKMDRQEKQSDLNGTEIMPQGTLSKPIRSNPSKSLPVSNKAASLLARGVESGHQVVGDLASYPVAPKVASRQKAAHYAMPSAERYPLDTAGHVKQAEAYFADHAYDLSPAERREFAQHLHLRADELGVKVGGESWKYAGEEYGPYIGAELLARERAFAGTPHSEGYGLLRQKISAILPAKMASLLHDADQLTGADRSYGRPGTGFRDPYQAVYGKVASEETDTMFSWRGATDYVSGPQLKALAHAGGGHLDSAFGKGFTLTFQKDPIGIFKSLPEPQKVVLSRMATDNNSGTTFRV